jgi:hypothetical protein
MLKRKVALLVTVILIAWSAAAFALVPHQHTDLALKRRWLAPPGIPCPIPWGG